MLEIIVSPEARLYQIEIADYLSIETGSAISERFLSAIERAFLTLSEMPNAGAPRDYGQPRFKDMRMLLVHRFPSLIFYRPTETEVQILRIIHGARDIEQIFQD